MWTWYSSRVYSNFTSSISGIGSGSTMSIYCVHINIVQYPSKILLGNGWLQPVQIWYNLMTGIEIWTVQSFLLPGGGMCSQNRWWAVLGAVWQQDFICLCLMNCAILIFDAWWVLTQLGIGLSLKQNAAKSRIQTDCWVRWITWICKCIQTESNSIQCYFHSTIEQARGNSGKKTRRHTDWNLENQTQMDTRVLDYTHHSYILKMH